MCSPDSAIARLVGWFLVAQFLVAPSLSPSGSLAWESEGSPPLRRRNRRPLRGSMTSFYFTNEPSLRFLFVEFSSVVPH
jgi:hypothetical protein